MPTPPSLVSLTAEADSALAEATALKYGDHQRLLATATLAASYAQRLGDFRRYGLALNHQAWAYGSLLQYELSLTHAMEALALARANGYLEVEARAVNIIAMNFVRCGIIDEARRLYEYQLELGERMNDPEVISMALHDLGILWLEHGDYTTAVNLITRSLEQLPDALQNTVDAGVNHANLAVVLDEIGRSDEAIVHAERALALAHADESTEQVGQTHTILGTIYMHRGDLDAAYRHVALARECLDGNTPTGVAANTEQLVSRLLALEGRDAESLAALERAYAIASKGGLLDFANALLNDLKTAYEQAGDSAGVIGVYERMTKDIPALQRRDSDLRFTVLRMVFAMDKAAAQAEVEQSRQKKRMLERITHEFRTPLTIIQSTAELVEQYGERMSLEQRQAKLKNITGQVKWLAVMLEDIIELFALDGQYTLPAAEQFRLDDLAEVALRRLDRYRISSRTIQAAVQPGMTVTGTRKPLETVLAHLLGNAVKFSKANVHLDLRVDNGMLVMRIADTGIGIPAREQAAVFQPLVRGSNLDEVTGNGIGLALVSRLVEQMRGHIDLDSTEGKGTTITVRVPVS